MYSFAKKFYEPYIFCKIDVKKCKKMKKFGEQAVSSQQPSSNLGRGVEFFLESLLAEVGNRFRVYLVELYLVQILHGS
jgi:hypothetical protein